MGILRSVVYSDIGYGNLKTGVYDYTDAVFHLIDPGTYYVEIITILGIILIHSSAPSYFTFPSVQANVSAVVSGSTTC